jgi:hypothetical protein
MNKRNRQALYLGVAVLTAAVGAQAQPVNKYTDNNDELLLGFTTPSSTGDLVIDLGKATQVIPGGTNTVDLIANGNVGQSAAALQAQLNNLYGSMNRISWGVVGGHYTSGLNAAIYSTVNQGASAPPAPGAWGQTVSSINTAGETIDGSGAVANQQVVDPTFAVGTSWSEIIAPGTTGLAFSGTYHNPNSTTPSTFAGATTQYQSEDLYLSMTSGHVVYQGHFTLGSDGSLTFTPASSVPTVPPPPHLSATRTNSTTTISFNTTNGVTYSLYYTNLGGLGTPVSSWPVSSTKISGDGTTKAFTDTTSDPDRVYRVKAQ